MGKREEELYFAVHGLEVKTAGELNAKLEVELARIENSSSGMHSAPAKRKREDGQGDADSNSEGEGHDT